MLVRVEPNETVDKVLEKIKSESNIWYGNKFNKQVSKHIIKNHLGEDVVYTDDEGILLLFDCHDTYTG